MRTSVRPQEHGADERLVMSPVFVHVRAGPLLDAFARDARADHLREPVDVRAPDTEAGVDLAPHRLRPRLGTEEREAEADLRRCDAVIRERLRERERIARRARDHVGTEVGDERQLALGQPTGHGHDGQPEPLPAGVEAESSGEEPVAVRVVQHHPRLRARHRQRAGVHARKELEVGCRVTDDR